MTNPPENASSPPVKPRSAVPGDALSRAAGFQFSVRTMFIAMTAVAIVAALAPLELVAGLTVVLLLVHLPAIGLAAFAWHARGTKQTFALGALGACLISIKMGGIGMLTARPYQSSWTTYGAYALFQIVSCLACGYLAVAVRRIVQRRGWDRPSQ